MKEEEFLNRVGQAFPELCYFADASEGYGERTKGALLSIFWLVADKHADFIRGQRAEEQLTVQSWSAIQLWMKETIKLTNEDAIDAMLVFIAIHALGKIHEFRAELAPDFKDPTRHEL